MKINFLTTKFIKDCNGSGRCRCGRCGGSGNVMEFRQGPNGQSESYQTRCPTCGGNFFNFIQAILVCSRFFSKN